MSVSVCELLLCVCTACVCMHVCVCNQKKPHTLEVIRDYTSLSVCLSHTHKHTHRVFPQRPSSSAIFTSDYTFHLLIFILICFSQTREGVKGVIGERERDWGGKLGEGGSTCIRSAEKEGRTLRKREIVRNFTLSNWRCPSLPQAK